MTRGRRSGVATNEGETMSEKNPSTGRWFYSYLARRTKMFKVFLELRVLSTCERQNINANRPRMAGTAPIKINGVAPGRVQGEAK